MIEYGDEYDTEADLRVPTSWEPVDLGPYLDGTFERPEPTLGLQRTDGIAFLYPGKEHAILGETESGKSWFCLACVKAEIDLGHSVLYIHFEEADPSGSVERLLALGVRKEALAKHFLFVGPDTAITPHTLNLLVAYRPSLVIHDGVNEAMALHGQGIYEADGVAKFRQMLVKPFTNVGAAVLSADHVTKSTEGRGKNAFGSVHKGNALDGTRISLENVRAFGRGKDGMSRVYVTKDRPGFLRAHGEPSKVPGQTYMGDLVVNDDPDQVFHTSLALFPPESGMEDQGIGLDKSLESNILTVMASLPDQSVKSANELHSALRTARKGASKTRVLDAARDLAFRGLLTPVPGPRGSSGYRLTGSSSPDE